MAKPKKFRPAIGKRLKTVLAIVFALFALIVVNSVYLVSVTVQGEERQGWFYLWMFLLHLILGLLIVVPTIVFGLVHLRNTYNRPNRQAVRAGWATFLAAILTFISGIALTRVDLGGFRLDLTNDAWRSAAYWAHVAAPLMASWMFVLHRLAGRRIKWKIGAKWAGVAAGFAALMFMVQAQDPRSWGREGPESADYFEPSLARTTSGDFIDAEVLDNDEYCLQCHEDAYQSWSHSAHRFSSFNNGPYAKSLQETRAFLSARDGNTQASRFCAGCHDPVPFLSGAFDDPRWDDPDYAVSEDPLGQAAITCTVCHAISHVNSNLGNAAYTMDEPQHYPFAFSENAALQWVNRQLVKAKPAFHKATFLKPFHQSAEFCGTCHKVHLPVELNGYKWLRGQNHYDAFRLSGVSGHGITSFYYPAKAQTNCNGCHMPLEEAGPGVNFGAEDFAGDGRSLVHNHQFLGANTGILHLNRDKMPDADAAIEAHREFNEGVMRVDLFGLREEGRIDGKLIAPLRPEVPQIEPGSTWLLETVIRTVKMGHVFTQGTSDSNEVWLEVTVFDGERELWKSGGMDDFGAVDPWAHFVNAFVIDRDGNRIDRRNAEDIYIPLYNHQIPPGAADSIHHRFTVPEDAVGPIVVEARLRYRKFDTTYMRFVTEDPNYQNDLPILELASDRLVLPLSGSEAVSQPDFEVPAWQRWNDYGIGLLRVQGSGLLKQARSAFEQVDLLGRYDGPLNLARLFLREGLIDVEAPDALARAADREAPAWSLLWFGAQVASRNGDFELAANNLRDILRGGFTQAEGRGFDFTRDERVHIALGDAVYQLALQERGEERAVLLKDARESFLAALALDTESLGAHWGLKQVARGLGDDEAEARHAALHAKYKPDDNARDRAVALARRKYPAANRAAEPVTIYELPEPSSPDMLRADAERP